MKKVLLILMMAGVFYLSSCSDMEPANPIPPEDQSITDDAAIDDPLAALGSSNITFGIYAETVPVTVKWDVDTKLDIWNGMTLVEQTAYKGDGSKAWKLTGTGSWMGMGIRVNPITTLRSLSDFSGGYLSFMFKGTKRFKIGIKSGGTTPVEKWIAMTNGKYGYYNNNAWCVVRVPLSVFSGVNLSKIEQFFMLAADSSLGYTVGSVYYIDKLYWYKTVTYNTSSSSSKASSVSSSSSSKSSVSSSSSSSSSKSSVSSASSSTSSTGSITVYTAGKIGSLAKSWINSTVQDIDNTSYSYATDIFLSGSDVYVSGRRNIGEASYWKNGVAVRLSDHLLSVANDIAVSGTNVYAVGNYLTSWYSFQPMLWKNGVATVLNGRSLTGISLSGSTIYACGNAGIGTELASYWMFDSAGNVTQYNLTPDESSYMSFATSIVATNNMVYVTARYYLSGINGYTASYWYGTAGTSLTRVDLETTRTAEVGKIAVSGDTLYIPGSYSDGANNMACYWVVKTGQSPYRVNLGPTGLNSFASAIAVIGNTVVASGYQNNGANNIACYWKNGVRTDIGPAGQDSSADALAVK